MRFLFSVLFFLTTSLVQAQKNYILSDTLKKHLYKISSEEFQGRALASLGEKNTVQYIVQYLQYLGLKPLPNNNGSFLQKVPLYRYNLKQIKLSWAGVPLEPLQDVYCLQHARPSKGKTEEVLFLGNASFDNLRLDVSQKVLLVRPNLAQSIDPMEHEEWMLQLLGAWRKWKKQGARALMIADVSWFEEDGYLYKTFQDQQKNPIITLASVQTPVEPEEGGFSMALEDVFFIKPAILDNWLLQTKQTLPKHGFKRIPLILQWQTAMREKLEGYNMLAYLEGTDKKEDYIMISAHHDHLGMKDEVLFAGADDNGSGTTALLAIAKNFAKNAQNGKKTKRSMVFTWFAGEEAGLLGSKYYTNDQPLLPTASIKALINVDMIGRQSTKNENLYYLSTAHFDRVLADLAKIAPFDLTNYYSYNFAEAENLFTRSDHYSFVKQGVPAIFYFGGFHADYHKSTDTAEKIQYELLQKRTQHIFQLAWRLAQFKNLSPKGF